MTGIPTYRELLAHLRGLTPSQEHVLAFWAELERDARERLARQILSLDLPLLQEMLNDAATSPVDPTGPAELAPPSAVRLSDLGRSYPVAEAIRLGEDALRAGRVGVIIVAGGQGSRLGFPHPKGCFPLGPVSRRSLLEMLIDLLIAVRHRYQAPIPLYLMTSSATNDELLGFLAQHHFFGLPAEDLFTFCQADLPAIDASTRQILLAAPDSLCLSPDGHGGVLAALDRNGCLNDARRRGIEHFFYCQVDNPLVQLCSPLLIGAHLLAQSDMTTQVARKRDASERVGNVVQRNGRMQIVEYIDLDESLARQTNSDGSLRLWAGNLAVHVIRRQFLEACTAHRDSLPLHRAHKKIASVDPQTGLPRDPSAPNAIKFERFIFDLLPNARNSLAVEAEPSEAFAPVKNDNSAPHDTPLTAQRALVRLHTQWLRDAGAEVADDAVVEIDPRWALDADELATKIRPGTRVSGTQYFSAERPRAVSPTPSLQSPHGADCESV